MRQAFVDLVTVALEAGADWDAVGECQHVFWSGNALVKASTEDGSEDGTEDDQE